MDRDESTAQPRDVEIDLDRAWRDHRRHLLDIGFRMLGSVSEAEDAVQEGFARLVAADLDEIEDVGGWLVVVVSRICLDKLRSRRRHPTASDSALAEWRLIADASLGSGAPVDPADHVTLDDNVRHALQLVLERLTPAERTAFILHDVFRYPFDAIAEIVGRTPAACRQLASRARRAIAADTDAPSRFRIESVEQRRVAERFIAACTTGDLDGLLAVLDPDVDGVTDVGGKVGTVTVAGRRAVATHALRYLGPASSTTLLTLPAGDEVAVVAMHDGQVVSMITVSVRDGRIEHIDAVANPDKLGPIARALGL